MSYLDYEKMFIGAILSGKIDGDLILKIRKEQLFSLECSELYDIMMSIYNETGQIDYLSVLDEYSKIKTLQTAKGIIDNIIAIVPPEFNWQRAVKNIERTYIIHKSVSIIDLAKNKIALAPDNAPEIMMTAYESVSKLSQVDKVSYDIEKEFTETIENVINGISVRSIIKTGFRGLDNIMGGLSTGEVTIIAGRPGHGKTTFSVALAKSILDNNPDVKVVKFELEMSKDQIKRKFLSIVSGISLNKMRTGQLSEADIIKLKEAIPKLESYKNRLYIYDDVYDIQTMTKIARSVEASVVLVDFITLMDDIGTEKRNDIGDIIITAKKFAKSKNIAFIMFSQLNRNPESRVDKRPTMSDIAESDQITQLASEIMLLFYRYKYTYDDVDKNILTVILDKARYSSVGQIDLYFNPEYSIIYSLEKV